MILKIILDVLFFSWDMIFLGLMLSLVFFVDVFLFGSVDILFVMITLNLVTTCIEMAVRMSAADDNFIGD